MKIAERCVRSATDTDARPYARIMTARAPSGEDPRGVAGIAGGTYIKMSRTLALRERYFARLAARNTPCTLNA